MTIRQIIEQALVSAGIPAPAVTLGDAIERAVQGYIVAQVAAYQRAHATGIEMVDRHRRECEEFIAAHPVVKS